jgi:hypothetical protein
MQGFEEAAVLISTDGLGYQVEKKLEPKVEPVSAAALALDPSADLAAIRAAKRRAEIEAMSTTRREAEIETVFASGAGDLDAAAAAMGAPKTKLSLRDQLAANKAASEGTINRACGADRQRHVRGSARKLPSIRTRARTEVSDDSGATSSADFFLLWFCTVVCQQRRGRKRTTPSVSAHWRTATQSSVAQGGLAWADRCASFVCVRCPDCADTFISLQSLPPV